MWPFYRIYTHPCDISRVFCYPACLNWVRQFQRIFCCRMHQFLWHFIQFCCAKGVFRGPCMLLPLYPGISQSAGHKDVCPIAAKFISRGMQWTAHTRYPLERQRLKRCWRARNKDMFNNLQIFSPELSTTSVLWCSPVATYLNWQLLSLYVLC